MNQLISKPNMQCLCVCCSQPTANGQYLFAAVERDFSIHNTSLGTYIPIRMLQRATLNRTPNRLIFSQFFSLSHSHLYLSDSFFRNRLRLFVLIVFGLALLIFFSSHVFTVVLSTLVRLCKLQMERAQPSLILIHKLREFNPIDPMGEVHVRIVVHIRAIWNGKTIVWIL